MGGPALSKEPLSVAAALTTTAFLDWCERDNEVVCRTPDGKRYVVLTVTPDMVSNGNWLNVLIGTFDYSGRPADPRPTARLFMTSLGGGEEDGATELTFGGSDPAHRAKWLDDHTLIFRWGDVANVVQVFALNVLTGKVAQLTAESANVRYVVARRGRIVYSVATANPDEADRRLLESGFAVRNPDLLSLINGHVSGRGFYDAYANTDIKSWDTTRAGTQRQVRIGPDGRSRAPVTVMTMSPDGSHALLDAAPLAVSATWSRYTEPLTARRIADFKTSGDLAVFGKTLTQLYEVDTSTAEVRPVIAAPLSPSDDASISDATWSPDGAHVLLTRALEPADSASVDGLAGRVALVVALKSGQISRVPVDARWFTLAGGGPRWDGSARWITDRKIAFSFDGEEFTYALRDSQWRLASNTLVEGRQSEKFTPSFQISLAQDFNTPPRLVVRELSRHGSVGGQGRVLYDPNPKLLADYSLGRAERIEWIDEKKRSWSGLYFHPVDFVPARAYPLVIQTHGYPRNGFTLYGMEGQGLGPGAANNVAQILANRGISVLQMDQNKLAHDYGGTGEGELERKGMEGAIDELVRRGWIDSTKIGLIGISRTGWHVINTLQYSPRHFAAALASEYTDPSYMWTAAVGWGATDNDLLIGAPAFGEGLQTWLDSSPGFNVERIHTPLRLENSAAGLGGIVLSWELFSRLRYLREPVELYVAPDIRHGSHTLQNPRQLLAVDEGTVDWFDFWINGREDRDPAKRDQYDRWEKLCDLQVTNSPNQSSFCVRSRK